MLQSSNDTQKQMHVQIQYQILIITTINNHDNNDDDDGEEDEGDEGMNTLRSTML